MKTDIVLKTIGSILVIILIIITFVNCKNSSKDILCDEVFSPSKCSISEILKMEKCPEDMPLYKYKCGDTTVIFSLSYDSLLILKKYWIIPFKLNKKDPKKDSLNFLNFLEQHNMFLEGKVEKFDFLIDHNVHFVRVNKYNAIYEFKYYDNYYDRNDTIGQEVLYFGFSYANNGNEYY